MENNFEKFEADNLFDEALKSGLTLFCGAGFSVESYDQNNKNLPLGSELLDELKREFVEIKSYSRLPRACTILEKCDRTSFYLLLKKRFEVKGYNPIYLELLKIRLKSIYTTNIDDLFFKLFEDADLPLHLIDRSQGAENNDDMGVDYFPLHGCVRNDGDYVFGATEIASAFSQNGMEKSWERLAKDSAQEPILFWGWNFEDSGPIEAMYGKGGNIGKNINKWVLLYDAVEETVDFLKSLGFNIIIGDTAKMLKYIEKFNLTKQDTVEEIAYLPQIIQKQLSKYTPPKNDDKLISYKFEDYFIDYVPQWSHIYSEQIPRTQYYTEALDLIVSGKNVIVMGIRASGKTTLMMQLIHGVKTNKNKYYMSSPSLQQVISFIKIINNTQVMLFVDDCFRDTNAVILLFRSKNIQTILFDRDHNYESQFHKLTKLDFQKLDITEISKKDAQSILDVIPHKLKKDNASTKKFRNDPTILNLLAANLKVTSFKFIDNFFWKDKEAARVFLMVCYVHSCGVPCSFDMIYSFLGDDKYNWEDMYEVVQRVGGLIKDYQNYLGSNVFFAEKQDYFQCRSRFLAEKIIQSIPKGNENFANILMDFLFKVPRYKIFMYDKFKKTAYDAMLIDKTFTKLEDGIKFYDEAAEKDNNEYIYQQAALYFSKRAEYKSAFEWIDKAKNLTHYNRFSIESTYAQIYFDVNYNKSETESINALNKLRQCCTNDKRSNIHFSAFAKRTLLFDKIYHNDKSRDFLKDAMRFIEEALATSNRSMSQINKWDLENYKIKIEEALRD